MGGWGNSHEIQKGKKVNLKSLNLKCNQLRKRDIFVCVFIPLTNGVHKNDKDT